MPAVACCATPLHYCGSVSTPFDQKASMTNSSTMSYVFCISADLLVRPDFSHSMHSIVRVETQQHSSTPAQLYANCTHAQNRSDI